MHHIHQNHGTCSSKVEFDLQDGKIRNVSFTGGCDGNAKGVSKLTEGLSAEEAIDRLSGIRCGFKSTSCPDQLAKALREALEKELD